MAPPLVCPECASEHGGDERFCARCGMPLVLGGPARGARSRERQRRARKIKPQYAQGALVRVVGARNQAEAELIAGMLLEEGIPSLLRRRRGFDVPDFMAAGPARRARAAVGARGRPRGAATGRRPSARRCARARASRARRAWSRSRCWRSCC